jgi:hypothetical protein
MEHAQRERETKAMTPLLCQQQPASDGCRIAPHPRAILIGCRISAVCEFDEHVGVAALRRTPVILSPRHHLPNHTSSSARIDDSRANRTLSVHRT